MIVEIKEIIKDKTHNIIYTTGEDVFINKHSVTNGSESSLTGHEELINALCDMVLKMRRRARKAIIENQKDFPTSGLGEMPTTK